VAQKSVPTVLKKQGRRNVIYRDTDGKTYQGIITNRDSATQADLLIRMGGTKVAKSNVPVATTHAKQTNVFYFRTGH
jgi:hypothetical protein